MLWNSKSKISYFDLFPVYSPSWLLLKAEKHLGEAGNENYNWVTIKNIILLECFIRHWHARSFLLIWNHLNTKAKSTKEKEQKATNDSTLTFRINPQGILSFIPLSILQYLEFINCGWQTCPTFFYSLNLFT